MTNDITVRFRLNGEERAISTPADARLVDLLRENFALTAARPPAAWAAAAPVWS